jgi:HK97 gp10 family phage protein
MARNVIARVRVDGLRELEKALLELAPSVGKGVMRRTLLKAGAPIQEQAQQLAPERDPDAPVITYKRNGKEVIRRPGTMKALVQMGTRLTKRQAATAKREGKSSVEVYVGTRDRMARLQEFGTSDTPAQPFMRPAWDANKDGAVEIIRTEMGGEIQKAAARAARKTARLAKKAGG